MANIWFVVAIAECVPVLTADSSFARQFNHDPSNFREPHLFRPERFLPGGLDGKSEPERDTHDISFGFGRRYVHALLYLISGSNSCFVENLPWKRGRRRLVVHFYRYDTCSLQCPPC